MTAPSFCYAQPAAAAQAVKLLLEYLDPVVLPVRGQDVPVGVDGDPLQALELGGAGAPLAEAAQVGAVGVEDLQNGFES